MSNADLQSNASTNAVSIAKASTREGQEREFAARYKGWADATLMYPRTSAMLMAISDDWARRAEHEDVKAGQG